MAITPEYLQNELKNLKAQRENALAVAQQANGAIALIESLLPLVEVKDSMTLEELRGSLGAKSAEIVDMNSGASAP